jgi:PAS domain S-box-containing protein
MVGKSEGMFRQLFETMNEGCALHKIIKDATGKPVDYLIMDINPAYEKILGLKKDEVVGNLATEVYGQKEPPYLDIYSKIVESGSPFSFETYYPPFNKHFNISVFSPQKDYFATVFTDITERKQNENKLQKSEQLFRSMFESHLAVMLLIDPDNGQIIDANPAAAEFYGYSRQILQTMKITEINQFSPDKTRKEWEKAANLKQNQFVFSHRLANGEVRKVSVYSSPINIQNRKILFSIIYDVTESENSAQALRASEELYRTLFNNMLNGFSYCRMINGEEGSLDFEYLSVNESFIRLTGLKNVEGKRVSEVIPGIQKSNPFILETYNKVASGGPPAHFETFLDSLNMWFEVSAYCPKPGYFVAVFDVITQRKQAEESLKEELNLRSRFIDVLAHELKGPLTPVINSSEILKDLLEHSPDDRLKKLASNTYNGATILSSKLDELLDMARFSKGTFTLNLVKTDFSKFIDEFSLRHKTMLEKMKQKIIFSIEEQLPQIDIDPSRIEQVLINLLSNACKYSAAGTIIDIKIKHADEFILLEVTDQGKGIAKEDLSTLFQPYRRLKKEQQNTQGLGLGLSICKQIVDAHKGKIEVISEVGKGSTFIVYLPII